MHLNLHLLVNVKENHEEGGQNVSLILMAYVFHR